MNYLPPELQKFNVFLDALPRLEKVVFLCCVCLLMCEAGKMRLDKITPPDEDWPLCYFETIAGKRFSVIKPPLDSATEAELVEDLGKIFHEWLGEKKAISLGGFFPIALGQRWW